ncbi:unnamed protein product [Mytilus coruscus]|uniref:Retrotransposon gag domain-containing protein n=1 Tax=Mytilus coruscus TaxID=42192 RepID=A0A6J8A865_MYTCO|nr:unnamed protein product [Mytilus coruscus]
MVNSLRELELATRKHLRCDTIESAGFWATKSRGEPVSPLVSLPLAQSSNPVSLPPAYHHMPTMSPPTTLASIQPSYHYLATMTSATPVNQPQPSYQHLPIMASTIPANHLLSQTMSQFQTATAQSHLPVPSVYPTTTATTTNHHIISSNFTDAFNNAYNHSFIYSRASGSTIEHAISIYTTTADLSSYLPIDVEECRDYEAFSPEKEGKAQQWFLNLSELVVTRNLLQALLYIRFKPTLLTAKMLQVEQEKSENVDDYIHRVMKLCADANLQEIQLMTKAMKGLRAATGRIVMSQSPINIEDLRAKAKAETTLRVTSNEQDCDLHASISYITSTQS